jgi:hypothetical protein
LVFEPWSAHLAIPPDEAVQESLAFHVDCPFAVAAAHAADWELNTTLQPENQITVELMGAHINATDCSEGAMSASGSVDVQLQAGPDFYGAVEVTGNISITARLVSGFGASGTVDVPARHLYTQFSWGEDNAFADSNLTFLVDSNPYEFGVEVRNPSNGFPFLGGTRRSRDSDDGIFIVPLRSVWFEPDGPQTLTVNTTFKALSDFKQTTILVEYLGDCIGPDTWICPPKDFALPITFVNAMEGESPPGVGSSANGVIPFISLLLALALGGKRLDEAARSRTRDEGKRW